MQSCINSECNKCVTSMTVTWYFKQEITIKIKKSVPQSVWNPAKCSTFGFFFCTLLWRRINAPINVRIEPMVSNQKHPPINSSLSGRVWNTHPSLSAYEMTPNASQLKRVCFLFQLHPICHWLDSKHKQFNFTCFEFELAWNITQLNTPINAFELPQKNH